MKVVYIVLSTIFLLSLGCESLLSPQSETPQPAVSGTVYLWVAADKDAYVSCGFPGSGGVCPEENLNYGAHGELVVSRSTLGIKIAYVHFLLPHLPEGTRILESYLELYHPGQQEDGQTDDVRIPVVNATAPWHPATLTYANQPNIFGASGEFDIRLRSRAWSGSRDITDIVTPHFNNRSRFYGFAFWWPFGKNPPIEKSFYSNNDSRRTASDLGLSPRLLVKIELPAGKSTDDIVLPPLSADNDLPFNGQEVLMLRFASGSNWPAGWNVAIRSGN